ncbi:MAG: nicotinate (nicotinamide) nucleotide adenylyltransferase [Thermodesulfobacteriota bacterium]
MHLAIFGGTFNPVHYGHLRGAEEVLASTQADKALFIPVFAPPHKDTGALAPAVDRMEMVRLAIEGNPAFELSGIEVDRGGVSYTIDTLKEILDTYTPSPELSLVIGTDSFNEFSSWHEYLDIIECANLVVIERPSVVLKEISEVLPVELARSFCYDSLDDSFKNSGERSIKFLGSASADISSSMIRALVGRGESARHLTPDKVIDYIEKNGLYR